MPSGEEKYNPEAVEISFSECDVTEKFLFPGHLDRKINIINEQL
jgi:hypothetical protein